MGLIGPSRTIIVEPLETPQPTEIPRETSPEKETVPLVPERERVPA